MPANLARKFQQAYSDPELLSSRGVVALLDARLLSLFGQIGKHGPAELWAKLKKLWAKLTAASAAGDAKAMHNVLGKVGKTIQAGASQNEIWQQIERTARERTAAAMADHKRQVDMQVLMTADEANAFVRMLEQAVLAEVHDRAMLIRIGRRIADIYSARTGRQVMPIQPADLPPAAVDAIDVPASVNV